MSRKFNPEANQQFIDPLSNAISFLERDLEYLVGLKYVDCSYVAHRQTCKALGELEKSLATLQQLKSDIECTVIDL